MKQLLFGELEHPRLADYIEFTRLPIDSYVERKKAASLWNGRLSCVEFQLMDCHLP
jgi:hypothetical protein